ncbi:MAG: GNAT family N-acetyltransferase [Planctomycetota bacterium]
MTEMPPTLQTARLTLRPFRIEDADTVRQLAGDQRVYQTTLNIPHPYPEGAGETWIATHLSQWLEKRQLHLAIVLQSSGQLIGAIGLMTQPDHDRAELGYWVGPEHWSHGYCTEAARAVVEYGFATMGLHRIYAHYMEGNDASGKVMEKIGLQYEGRLVDHVVKDDGYRTIICYGLLEELWRRQQDED